ncbi:hypothetical protein KL86DES1_10927 [uncultured Desulfovibrio sp.]|uniref:Uncharacterized protein n=1 Tax=uncultured Desulfovibrio sp. TaxID=167968 RepID=A0A212L0Z6_9BACT|nr:hypothetical protein KL86DES1_10927 [uncultured Desulfovibrio sp.]VZH32799.1 conserved protein of unknown function [Desulfovibrio sp. 86]
MHPHENSEVRLCPSIRVQCSKPAARKPRPKSPHGFGVHGPVKPNLEVCILWALVYTASKLTIGMTPDQCRFSLQDRKDAWIRP